MKFGKPPVVEVWISIEFDPPERKQQFDIELLKDYIGRYGTELPKLETIYDETLRVQETAPGNLLRVIRKEVQLEFVRLWDDAKSCTLTVGDDQISYHMLKHAGGTPGYHSVRNAAESKIADYIEVFQPTRIRNATLHYLDIIDIPIPSDGKLALQDYFPHAVDVPETPFGPITSLTHEFQTMCPTDPGPLFVRLQSLPASSESQVIRFRLDWHKLSANVDTLELPKLWERMDEAHQYMRDCFTSALSERTLQLFDPVKSEES